MESGRHAVQRGGRTMESFIERLLIELLLIAIQLAAIRVYAWLRSVARMRMTEVTLFAAA